MADFTTDCNRHTLNLPSDLLFGDGSGIAASLTPQPFSSLSQSFRSLLETSSHSGQGQVIHPAVSIGLVGKAPMITLPERPQKSGAWSVLDTITDLEVVPTQGAFFITQTVVGQTQKVSPTVSLSMGPNHVPQETVHTVMPVSSVEIVNIMRRHALLEAFCPVSTPLIVPV
ncbi:hypothetical protein C0993_006033 [Termitomyces sp. T159_Od127]|nr:hypothetical protein C0993_006033 [Termitomyces sp. T159_Od127]